MNKASQQVNRNNVSAMYRYPVKSTLGERVEDTYLDIRGMLGDRTHAFVDSETGKVASAKRPALWRRLMEISCRVDDDDQSVVHLTLPDGRITSSNDPSASRAVSDLLSRSVELCSIRQGEMVLDRAHPEESISRGVENEVESITLTIGGAAPEGGFFDYAPIHVITVQTLQFIASIVENSNGLEQVRYRPNLVIDCGQSEPFEENAWTGRTMAIGEARLRFLLPSPRCVVPTLSHGPLPARASLLRAITANNMVDIPEFGRHACLGAYAEVTAPGRVSAGDALHWT